MYGEEKMRRTRSDLMVICRFHVDLYEDAVCSCNIRHVVPNVGSGLTGCANRVRRTSNNEIDDEAAGEAIGRTTSSARTRRSSTRLCRALDLLADYRYSILHLLVNVIITFVWCIPIKSLYAGCSYIDGAKKRNSFIKTESNLNLKVDNNFCICFDILILWKNPNSCNFINLFFQID